MEEKNIILLKRPRLSKGQRVLFDLIDKKIKTGDKLTLEESKKIYVQNACRNFSDGKPAVYNYWYKATKQDEQGMNIQWQGRYEPMNEQYLGFVVLQWLTHNIGSLVLKGYLKVLPIIEFE